MRPGTPFFLSQNFTTGIPFGSVFNVSSALGDEFLFFWSSFPWFAGNHWAPSFQSLESKSESLCCGLSPGFFLLVSSFRHRCIQYLFFFFFFLPKYPNQCTWTSICGNILCPSFLLASEKTGLAPPNPPPPFFCICFFGVRVSVKRFKENPPAHYLVPTPYKNLGLL